MKAEAIVKGDEARVAEAQLNVQNCMVKAPIGGRVGKIALHRQFSLQCPRDSFDDAGADRSLDCGVHLD